MGRSERETPKHQPPDPRPSPGTPAGGRVRPAQSPTLPRPTPAAPTLSLRATVCLMPWVAGAAAIAAPRPTRVAAPSPGECPVTSTRRRDPPVSVRHSSSPSPCPLQGAYRPSRAQCARPTAGSPPWPPVVAFEINFIYDDIKYTPGLTGPQRPVRVRPCRLGTTAISTGLRDVTPGAVPSGSTPREHGPAVACRPSGIRCHLVLPPLLRRQYM